MGDQWHYSRGGKQAGSVSSPELKQLAATGQLAPTDMVSKDGMPNWVSAKDIKGLFAVTNSNVPPPLPPASPPTQNDPLSILRAPIIAGLHRQRFAVCFLAGIGILATFMPWVHAPIVGSIAGTAGVGWFTLALFIPAMVLGWRGQKLQPLIGNVRLGAAIPACLAGLIGLSKVIELNSLMAGANRDNPFAAVMAASVQIGMGLYLMIAASAALVAVCMISCKPIK
jgi:hypothetical protein